MMKGKTIGDLTLREAIESAQQELDSMGEMMNETIEKGAISPDKATDLRAYMSSIWIRLWQAQRALR